MTVIKYDLFFNNITIQDRLTHLINQIYKLLPSREEGKDWVKPLDTIVEEFCGLHSLLMEHEEISFPLICKLEGLYGLCREEDFDVFRRTIFECISLINKIKEKI